MELKSVLNETGLSANEANLYLASLKIGPESILALSKATKIHRPALYKMLESLLERGVFKTTIYGKRKLFFAVSPKQLLGYLKNKEMLLRGAIPELEALIVTGTNKPKILYFEEREQIQELFKNGLECRSKEMYSFFPSKYMAELFGKREMEQIIRERVQRGIHVKTLRSAPSESEYEGSELTAEALRDIRYIPQEKAFAMGIVIFDNKVNIFSPIDENFGIQIESEAFSSLMKMFFETLWSVSKESGTEEV